MTGEEMERAIQFILDQQARAEVRAAETEARAAATDRRLARLERVVSLAIRAGVRERRDTREKINALVAAQMRADERADRLAAAVERLVEGGGI